MHKELDARQTNWLTGDIGMLPLKNVSRFPRQTMAPSYDFNKMIPMALLVLSLAGCYGSNHETNNQNGKNESTATSQMVRDGSAQGTNAASPGANSVPAQESPLFAAIRQGNMNTVEELITKGADVNVTNAIKQTPLHEAAFFRRRQITALLLTKGAKINAKDMHGMTPLHAATLAGAKQIATFLIANGADVNAKDNREQTPLHLAGATGEDAIAELLIKNGADVKALDSNGTTPLSYATNNGHNKMATLLTAKHPDK